jgi:Tfp pilus assembly protein PilN
MKAVNLLPSDLRSSPKRGAVKAPAADEPGGLGAYAVLGALALCVVALAAYVLTTNAVKDRKAQLDAATAQVQATTQRAAELKPYADFQALAETRIQTVRDLASARFDWEQALRDISRALPDEVSLTTLNGSISTGGGGNALRGAIAAPAIELAGCTTDQTAVARLLSRLRNVDGVTRVSLAKSVKADTPATAPTDPGQGAPGCGIGRPPAFEVVIFFERSEVPATVQDVTVQAGAADATPGAATGTTTGAPAATGTQPASGITTPPADPADQPAGATATPASTPQGTGSR